MRPDSPHSRRQADSRRTGSANGRAIQGTGSAEASGIPGSGEGPQSAQAGRIRFARGTRWGQSALPVPPFPALPPVRSQQAGKRWRQVERQNGDGSPRASHAPCLFTTRPRWPPYPAPAPSPGRADLLPLRCRRAGAYSRTLGHSTQVAQQPHARPSPRGRGLTEHHAPPGADGTPGLAPLRVGIESCCAGRSAEGEWLLRGQRLEPPGARWHSVALGTGGPRHPAQVLSDAATP